MEMLFLLLLIVGFFFLFGKINSLEQAIKELKSQAALQPKLASTEDVAFNKTKVADQSATPAISKTVENSPIPTPPFPATVNYQQKIQQHSTAFHQQPQIIQSNKVASFTSQTTTSQIKNEDELEFKFGSKIFTIIGTIAVTLGIGFFFRYAFENNLISETMRVVIGCFFGLTMMGAGWFLKEKYQNYSQMLTGGGIGILYLSIFAAYNYYEIMSQPVAFVLMSLITASGIGLAIKYDAIVLAVMAQLGGFLTPFLLSSNQDRPHALFCYIILLNLGILATAYYKSWRGLIWENFVGTGLIFLIWVSSSYEPEKFSLAISYLSIFYLIFLVSFILRHFRNSEKEDAGDFILVSFNSILYFLAGYWLFENAHANLTGLFTGLLAIFHLGLFFFLHQPEKGKAQLSHFMAAISAGLFVLVIPIQFDRSWVTIGWAAEALILTYMGFSLKFKALRDFGQMVFTLVLIRLITIDSMVENSARPWLNDRVYSFLPALSAYGFGIYLHWKHKAEDLVTGEKQFSWLLIQAAFIFLWFGSFQINSYYPHWFLSAFWSVAVLLIMTLALFLQNQPTRILAFIMMGITFVRLIFVDSDLGSGEIAWLNSRFFVFLVAILTSCIILLIQENWKSKLPEKERQVTTNLFFAEMFILLLWLGSGEINDFHDRHWLPIWWALVCTAAGYFSGWLQNTTLRYLSYGMLLFTIGYLLIAFNNVNFQSYQPLLNYRFLSFFSVIVLGGLYAGQLYQENKKNSQEYLKNLHTLLIIGINFAALWIVSLEVLDYFNWKFAQMTGSQQKMEQVRIDNWKNMSLSIAWTFYAIAMLIAGIVRKSLPARFLSIFLFGIVIFKVFLYDTASLSNFYRFISFITLGIVLLLTGYLYNRYKNRIFEFIKVD